jgi:putative alpha-1,2-mannosidase
VKPAFKDRGLSFTHDDEFSSASYYSIKLTTPDKEQIFAELSGASRAGIMRVTFPEGSSPYVSMQATRAGFKGQVKIDPLRHEISGYNPERQDSVLGPDKAPSFKGYFVVRFQERFESFGTALDSDLSYQSTSAEGEIVSAFVTFPKNTQKVHFKVGVSFISIDQARRNIDLEIPDGKSLEQVSDETASKWAEKVDLVKLYGASEDQKKVFYTAMFHAFQVSLRCTSFFLSHFLKTNFY